MPPVEPIPEHLDEATFYAPYRTEIGRRLLIAFGALTGGIVPRDLIADVLYAIRAEGATSEEALAEVIGAEFLFTGEQGDINFFKEHSVDADGFPQHRGCSCQAAEGGEQS